MKYLLLLETHNISREKAESAYLLNILIYSFKSNFLRHNQHIYPTCLYFTFPGIKMELFLSDKALHRAPPQVPDHTFTTVAE